MTGLPRKSNPRVSAPRGDSKLDDLKESLPCEHETHQPCAPHPATLGQKSPQFWPCFVSVLPTREVTLNPFQPQCTIGRTQVKGREPMWPLPGFHLRPTLGMQIQRWQLDTFCLCHPLLACPLLWKGLWLAGLVKVHSFSGLIKFCFKGDVSYLGAHRVNGFSEVFQVVT